MLWSCPEFRFRFIFELCGADPVADTKTSANGKGSKCKSRVIGPPGGGCVCRSEPTLLSTSEHDNVAQGKVLKV